MVSRCSTVQHNENLSRLAETWKVNSGRMYGTRCGRTMIDTVYCDTIIQCATQPPFNNPFLACNNTTLPH